jgi:hypothetical protein
MQAGCSTASALPQAVLWSPERLQERRQIRAAEIVRVKRERSEEPEEEEDAAQDGPRRRQRPETKEEPESGEGMELSEQEEDEGKARRARRRRGDSEEPAAPDEPPLEVRGAPGGGQRQALYVALGLALGCQHEPRAAPGSAAPGLHG